MYYVLEITKTGILYQKYKMKSKTEGINWISENAQDKYKYKLIKTSHWDKLDFANKKKLLIEVVNKLSIY